MAPDLAHADAALDVAISVRNQPILGGVTAWDIVVSNPGTEVLGSLVLTANGALDIGEVTGPTVTIGNADNQLDPGEVWTYAASGRDILGFAGVVASAVRPLGEAITAQDVITYPLKSPLVGSALTAATAVLVGTVVEWQVEYENVANFAVTIASAEARVLDPGSGLVPYDQLTSVSKGLDGDDVMQPGEVWTWRFSAAVTIDGSYLSAVLGFETADGSGAFGTPEVRSPAIVVTSSAPETSPTTPAVSPRVLPATGHGSTRIAWFACGLVVVGAMSLVAGRRRVRTNAGQQR